MKKFSKADVYIDAEWASTGELICTQVLITSMRGARVRHIIFNEPYRELVESKGYKEGPIPGRNARLQFAYFSDNQDVLTPLVYDMLSKTYGEVLEDETLCNLYMFYSPKDIWAAIGFNNFLEFVNTPRKDKGFQIDQKRTLRGSFVMSHDCFYRFRYKIKDVSGWTNSGLMKLANSLGISVKEKTLLDDYKSQMEVGLEKCTDDFLRYALYDVSLLEQIVLKQVKQINWICDDILKMDLEFDQQSIPMSQGSLVSTIFNKYLYSLLNGSKSFQGVKSKHVLNAAFSKLGEFQILQIATQ